MSNQEIIDIFKIKFVPHFNYNKMILSSKAYSDAVTYVYNATRIFKDDVQFSLRLHYILGITTIEDCQHKIKINNTSDIDFVLSNITRIGKGFVSNSFNTLLNIIPFAETAPEAMYCYINNITEKPKCKNCGNHNKFIGGITAGHYTKFCSSKCQLIDNNSQKILKYDNTVTKNDVIEILKNIPKDLCNTSNSKIANIYFNIVKLTPHRKENDSIQQRVYDLINDITSDISCTCSEGCPHIYKFISLGIGYKKTKHKRVIIKKERIPQGAWDITYYRNHMTESQLKIVDSLGTHTLEIYRSVKYHNKVGICLTCGSPIHIKKKHCNTKCAANNKSLKASAIAKGMLTRIEKGMEGAFAVNYEQFCSGITNISQTNHWKEIVPINNYKKYGVTNTFQLPHSIQNAKAAFLYSCAEIIEKSKQTRFKKYGDRNYCNKEQVSKTKRDFFNSSKLGIRGYVYVMSFSNHDYIKIGVSINPEQRLKDLEKYYGVGVLLSQQYTHNSYEDEKYFHKKYDEYNIVLPEGEGRTEFFDLSYIDMKESFIQYFEGKINE